MNLKSEFQVIKHYIERAKFDGRLGLMTYWADVAEHVMNTVPESDRTVNKATGRGKTKLDFYVILPSDDIDAIDFKRKENAKKIGSYINGDVYPPMQLRRSLIACLPEPYQTECRRQLYRDEGFLCVPIYNENKPMDVSAMHREYADAVMSQAELLKQDGEISANDPMDKLLRHRKELMDLLETVHAELLLTESVIDKKQNQNGVTPIRSAK